eukprot:9890664-Heterocapsa_arctica.AAC.1
MEEQFFLEAGQYRAEDRTHRLFPSHQADAEEDFELVWRCQTVADRSDEHYPDEEEGFQFVCDRDSKE